MSGRRPEPPPGPAQALLLGGSGPPLRELVRAWREDGRTRPIETAPTDRLDWFDAWPPGAFDCALYLASAGGPRRPGPDLAEAARFFQGCLRLAVPRVVVVSSAAVYEPSPHHPGMVMEGRPPPSRTGNPIARSWRLLEDLAIEKLEAIPSLTLLRPAPVLLSGGVDYFSLLFRSRWAARLPGHDPTLQLLALLDFARAAAAALEERPSSPEIRHVAPRAGIPLRAALASSGTRGLPLPRTLQRPLRGPLSRLGLAFPLEQLDYIRYGWTIDSARDAPLQPRQSSHQAVSSFSGHRNEARREPKYDDFGMDRAYIGRLGKSLFRFLHDAYWRVEMEGIERIPAEGPAVLVGLHRGFMPFDGVMALHELATMRGRFPRFLIHPGLVKFPFFFNFITKLGGVPACRENADRILRRGGILGVFPEGVRGAFSMYRDAYRLKRFGRLEFVRLAIRHRAPILPFVTVGSAETFPILGKIESEWWRRRAEWPFIPITPTFPLLPVPLPSKWRTRYLEPVRVERTHPPEAAEDPAAVREIGRSVRRAMQRAIDQLLARRRSIFLG